jgi:hypothetical protein
MARSKKPSLTRTSREIERKSGNRCQGRRTREEPGKNPVSVECHLNSSQTPFSKRALASARGRSRCLKLS